MRKKNTSNDMRLLLQMCIQYFYQEILYRSVLPLHKSIWLSMALRGYKLLCTIQVVHASTHTINKSSPLIIYLDFEATTTTHKLIKKRSYRHCCYISDLFGLRQFSEIMKPENKMTVAIHLKEVTKI